MTVAGEHDIDWSAGPLLIDELVSIEEDEEDDDLDGEDDYWSGSATNVPRPGSP